MVKLERTGGRRSTRKGELAARRSTSTAGAARHEPWFPRGPRRGELRCDLLSKMHAIDTLQIDLSGLEIEEIEILAHGGSRGMPEFSASSAVDGYCGLGACSCTVDPG